MFGRSDPDGAYPALTKVQVACIRADDVRMHTSRYRIMFGVVSSATALAACGVTTRAPTVSTDGSAVIRDLNDGKLDGSWSCGALRAALARLPVGFAPPY